MWPAPHKKWLANIVQACCCAAFLLCYRSDLPRRYSVGACTNIRYDQLDKHAIRCSAEYTTSIPSLVSYLSRSTNSDEELARTMTRCESMYEIGCDLCQTDSWKLNVCCSHSVKIQIKWRTNRFDSRMEKLSQTFPAMVMVINTHNRRTCGWSSQMVFHCFYIVDSVTAHK